MRLKWKLGDPAAHSSLKLTVFSLAVASESINLRRFAEQNTWMSKASAMSLTASALKLKTVGR